MTFSLFNNRLERTPVPRMDQIDKTRSVNTLNGRAIDSKQDNLIVAPGGENNGVMPFAKNLFFGNNTMMDVYQKSKYYGVDVKLETPEVFAELYRGMNPEATDDDIERGYFVLSNYYDAYLAGTFNAFEYNGNYDMSGGDAMGSDDAIPWQNLDGRFKQHVSPTEMIVPGVIEPVKFQEEQDYANKRGFWVSKDGSFKTDEMSGLWPSGGYDEDFFNARQIAYDENGYPYWQEAEDGAVLDPSLVEPSKFFGPKKMNSSILGSFYRGFHSGVYVKTGKAAQFLLGISTDIWHTMQGYEYNGDLAEYYSKSALGRAYLNTQNHLNRFQKQQWDEKSGYFNDVNAWFYSTLDVAGQASIVYLSAGSMGAIGMGSKLGVQLSLAIGGFTSGGMRREELLDKGYSIQAADWLSVGYVMQTIAAENVFRSNLIAKAGFGRGKRMFSSPFNDDVAKVTRTEIQESGAVGVLKATETQAAKGTGIISNAFNRATNLFGKGQGKTVATALEKTLQVGRRAVASGAEESTEEVIEGFTNKATAIGINNFYREHAASALKLYDVPFLEVSHPVTGEAGYMYPGEDLFIPGKEHAVRQRSVTHAKDIVSGKSSMDEEMHTDEYWAAFFGSMLVGGAGSIYQYRKEQEVEANIVSLSYDIEKNPTLLDKAVKRIKKMVNDGEIAKEKEDVVIEQFTESINFYRAVIKEMKMESPLLLQAVGEDKSLLLEYFQEYQHNKNLKAAKAEIEGGKTFQEVEYFKEKREDLIERYEELEEEKKKTYIDDLIATSERTLAYYNVPKEEMTYQFGGKTYTGLRSGRFSDKFTNVLGKDSLIDEIARRQVQSRKSPFWKKFFDSMRGDKAAKASYEAEVDKVRQAIMNSKKFTYLLQNMQGTRTREGHIIDLTTKFDYFRDGVHKEGYQAFIDRHNEFVSSMQKGYDEAGINTMIAEMDAFFDQEIEFNDNEGKSQKQKVGDWLDELGNKADISGTLAQRMKNNKGNEGLKDIVTQLTTLDKKLKEFQAATQYFELTEDQGTRVNPLIARMVDTMEAFRFSLNSTSGTMAGKSSIGEEIDTEVQGKINDIGSDVEELFTEVSPIDPKTTAKYSTVENINQLREQDADFAKTYSTWIQYFPSLYNPETMDWKVLGLLEGFLSSDDSADGRGIHTSLNNLYAQIERSEAAFANQDALREDMAHIVQLIQFLDEYVDMNRILYQEDFEETETRVEHSRLNEWFKGPGEVAQKFSNESVKLDETQARGAKDLVKNIIQKVANWDMDRRFTEVNKKNNIVKAWIASTATDMMFVNQLLTKGLIIDKKIEKDIDEAIDEINLLLKKYKDKGAKDTDLYPVWNLGNVYFAAKKKKKKSILNDLALINKYILDIEAILSSSKKQSEHLSRHADDLSSKYTKVSNNLEGIYSANPFSQSLLLSRRNSDFTELLSHDSLNTGRDLLERGQTVSDEEEQTLEYYVSEAYTFFKGVAAQNTGKYKRRQVYQQMEQILTEENKGKSMSPIDTWEQSYSLSKAVVFIGDENNEMSYKGQEKHITNVIQRGLTVGGYGGSGKTVLFSKRAIQVISGIEKRPANVVIVANTEDVKDKHERTLVELGDSVVAGEIVKVYDLFAEKGKKMKSLLSKVDKKPVDFVIWEEYSLLSMPEAMVISNKLKGEFPILFIGDTAQTPNLAVETPYEPAVDRLTLSLRPLTEQFRGGYVGIHLLQDYYRKAFFVSVSDGTIESLPQSQWKYDGEEKESNKVGTFYYQDSFAGLKQLQEDFLKAAEEMGSPTVEQIVLIVDTYKDFHDLMEDDRFKKFRQNVRVLESSATNEAVDESIRDLNISGMDSEMVYVATRSENWTEPSTYYALMVTSVGRGTNYVAVLGDEKATTQLTAQEKLSKYTDFVEDEDQHIENRAEVIELLKIINEGVVPDDIIPVDPPIVGASTTSIIYDEDVSEINSKKIKKNVNKAVQTVKNKKAAPGKEYTSISKLAYKDQSKKEKEKAAKVMARARLFSASVRVAGDNTEETLKLFESAYVEYNKQFEVQESAKFRKAVLAIGEAIFGIMEIDPTTSAISKTFYHVGNKSDKGISGTPLAVTVVGYKKDKDKNIIPIVDIIGVLPEGKEMNPEMTHTKERLTQYGMYVALLGKKGMLVNQVRLASVNTTATPYYQGELTIDIATLEPYVKEAQKNDNLAKPNRSPFATSEELYSIPRVEPDMELSSFEKGQYVVLSSRASYRINGVVLIPGESEHYLEVSLPDNTIELVKESELKGLVREVTYNPLAGLYLNSANRFVESEEVYTNNIAVPVFSGKGSKALNAALLTKLSSYDNFYDHRENQWLAAKQYLATLLSYEAARVEKHFTPKHKFYNAKTKKYEVYYDVFFNRIPEASLKEIYKNQEYKKVLNDYGYKSYKQLLEDRLDVVSYDGHPDYMFQPGKQRPDDTIQLRQSPGGEYSKFLAGELSKQELADFLKASFNATIPAFYERRANINASIEKIVAFNVYKMELIKATRDMLSLTPQQEKLTEGQSVRVAYVDYMSQEEIAFGNSGTEMSLNKAIKNMGQEGYEVDLNTFEWQSRPGVKDAKMIMVVVTDSTGKRKGTFPVYPKRIPSKLALANKINSLKKGIEAVKSEIEALQVAIGTAKTVQEQNEIRAKQHAIIRDLEAVEFIEHNKGVISNYPESFKDVASIRVKKTRRYVQFAAYDAMMVLNQIQATLLQIQYIHAKKEKTNNKLLLFQPVIMGSGQKGIVGLNVKNLNTHYDRAYSPRTYFSKVDIPALSLDAAQASGQTLQDYMKQLDSPFNTRGPGWGIINNAQDTNIDTALEELSEILGVSIIYDKNVAVTTQDRLKTTTGEDSRGQVVTGLIKLYEIATGKISGKVHMHEAIHYILEHMATPEEAFKVLNDAKQKYASLHGMDVADVTFRDAHEYLAQTYEAHRILKMEKRTWVGKFINKVKRLFFKLRYLNAPIQDFFDRVDEGYFAGRTPSTKPLLGGQWNAVKSPYTSSQGVKALSKAFKNAETADFILGTIVAPGIVQMSRWGKGFDAFGGVDNNRGWWEAIQEYYAEGSRKYKGTDALENAPVVIIKGKQEISTTVGQLTPDDVADMTYDLKLNTRGTLSGNRKRNIRTLGLYAMRQFYLMEDSKNNPELYYMMIQKMFPGINIYNVVHNDSNAFKHTHTGSHFDSEYEANPTQQVNNFLRLVVESTGLLSYKKRTPIALNNMSWPVTEQIIRQARTRILDDGYAFSMPRLQNELLKMLTQVKGTTRLNHIYTFLMEFTAISPYRTEVRMKSSGRDANGVFIPNAHAKNNNETKQYVIYGQGYKYLSGDIRGDILYRNKRDILSPVLDGIAQKKEAYKEIERKLFIHFNSWEENALIGENPNARYSSIKKLHHQSSTMSKATLRENAMNTNFMLDGATVIQEVVDKYLGKERIIKVTPTLFQIKKSVINELNEKEVRWVDVFKGTEAEIRENVKFLLTDIYGTLFSQDIVRDILEKDDTDEYVNQLKKDGIAYDVAENMKILATTLFVSSVQTAMPTGNVSTREMETALKMTKWLEEVYVQKNTGYEREHSPVPLYQKDETLDGERFLYPYSPNNLWEFTQNVLAYNMDFNEDTKVPNMTNVNGKIMATLVKTSTMKQTQRGVGFRARGDMPYVKKLKNKIKKLPARRMRDGNPFYGMDKDNKLQYYNPILAGQMKYDVIYEYVSKTGDFRNVDAKKMTKYDIFRTLYDWTVNNMGKKQGLVSIPVLLDIYSDRSKLWFTEWFAEGRPTLFTPKKEGANYYITDMDVNYEVLADMFDSLYEYSQRRKRKTAKAWKKVTDRKPNEVVKGTELQLVTDIQIKLYANLDYKIKRNEKGDIDEISIGNGYTQSTNRLLDVPESAWKKMSAEEKYNKVLDLHRKDILELNGIASVAGYQTEELGEEGAPDIDFFTASAKAIGFMNQQSENMLTLLDNTFAFGSAELQQQVEAVRLAIINLNVTDLTELTKSEVRDLHRTLTASIIALQESQKAVFSEVSTNPLYASAIKIRERILPETDLFEKQSSVITEVMFMTGYLFNNSFTQVARGPHEFFEDLTDYYKRGLGYTAPGDIYSDSETNYMEAIVLEDEWATNELFGGQIQITDGVELINPIWHRYLKYLSGGELSDIGTGAIKNVNYYFDAAIDNIEYVKSAQMPINSSKLNDPFYQSALYAMLTPQLRKKYAKKQVSKDGKITYKGKLFTLKGKAWDSLLDEIVQEILLDDSLLTYEDKEGNRHNMAALITHKSALKSGIRSLGSYYQGWDAKNEKDAQVSMIIDPQSKEKFGTVPLPLEYLKLQSNVSKNVFEATKTIPQQLLSVVGAGSPNNIKRGRKINKAMADLISAKATAFTKAGNNTKTAQQFIRDISNNMTLASRDSNKQSVLYSDKNIDILTWRTKGISNMVNEINDVLKPHLPGVNMVQMPALETIYQYKGRAYTSLDQSLYTGHEFRKGKQVMKKVLRRKLAPMTFWKYEDGKFVKYTDKKELIKDSRAARAEQLKKKKDQDKDIVNKIQIRAAEVIAPFIHAKRFGITEGKSLNALMTVLSIDGTNTQNYRTELRKFTHYNKKQLVQGTGNIIGLEIMLAGLSVEEIAGYVDPDVYSFALSKAKALIGKKEGETGEKQELLASHLIDQIAEYFVNLNFALDLYQVRIPTTNASSGFIGRIIEFSWDYENTIFVSPEKNILDGSDYDIDELHVYIRPMQYSDVPRKVYEFQDTIFKNISDFYYEGANAEYMVQNVSPDGLTDYWNASPGAKMEESSNQGALNQVLEERKRQMAGGALVGHFANLETAYLRINQITKKKREQIFSPQMIAVHNEELFALAVETISILINGATDNSKLGGVLGKLNISEESSPLVTGMVMSGILGDALYTELSRPIVRQVIDEMYTAKTNKRGSFSKGRLQMYLYEQIQQLNNQEKKMSANLRTLRLSRSGKEGDELEAINKNIDIAQAEYEKVTKNNIQRSIEYTELLNYAVMGEQTRRLNDIIGIPSRVKGNHHGIYNNIRNVEIALGADISTIMRVFNGEQTPPNIFTQTRYSVNNATQYREGTAKHNAYRATEKLIRNTFDMWDTINQLPHLKQYIKVLNAANTVLERGYEIYNPKHKSADKMIYDSLPYKTIFDQRDMERYDYAKTDIVVGMFLNSLTEVNMNVEEQNFWDFSSHSDRQAFVESFRYYVEGLRLDNPGNSFLNALNMTPVYNQLTQETDYSLIELKNSYYIDEQLKLFLIQDFNNLSKTERNAFRYYNLLVYGFDTRNGSMNEILGVEMERKFSKWLRKNRKSFDTKYGYGVDYAKEVFTRNSSMLPSSVSSNLPFFTKWVKGQGGKVYKKDGKNINDVTMPFNTHVNTYGLGGDKRVLTTFPFPFATRLGIDELNSLHRYGNYTVHTVKKHRHPLSKTNKIGEKITRIAVVNDGSLVNMAVPDKKTIQLQVRPVNPIRSSTIPRSTEEKQVNNSAAGVIELITTKLRDAFPNIEVIEEHNPPQQHQHRLAWIDEGVVFLNMNIVEPGTPFHEFGHIFMAVLREAEPGLYNSLLSLAKDMVLESHPTALRVQGYMGEVTEEDYLDEIVAVMLGWNSEDYVMQDYIDYETGNFVIKGNTFWNNVKDTIFNALRKATKLISNILKIHISPQKFMYKDLNDFARYFVRQVMKGNVISEVSTNELAVMETMLNIKASVVPKRSIKSLNDLNKSLGLSLEANLTDEQMLNEMDGWATLIRKNDNVLPMHFLGREISFTDAELANMNKHNLLWNTVDSINKKGDEFPDIMANFIKSGADIGDENQMALLFGKKRDRVVADGDNIFKVLKSMGNMPGYQVMTLKDMMRKYNITYDESMITFNPLVQVEMDNKDGIIISLFDITRTPLNEPVEGYDKGTLFSGKAAFVTEGLSKAIGVTLTNSKYDLRRLNLAIQMNYLMASDNRIRIRQAAVVGMRPRSFMWKPVDTVNLNYQIKQMGKVDAFQNALADETGVSLKSIFNGDDIRYRKIDWLSYVMQYWASDDELDLGYTTASFTNADTNDKVRMLNDRLRYLLSIDDKDMMQSNEILYLHQAIEQLNNPNIYDDQVNITRRISGFEATMFDVTSIAQEDIQQIKGYVELSSRKVVNKVFGIKKDLKNTWKHFTNKAAVQSVLGDPTKQQYGSMFDTIEDSDGNMRYTGLIYWTTRITDDMTEGEKALARRAKKAYDKGLLTDEDLAHGELIVNTISQGYVDMLRHRKRKTYKGDFNEAGIRLKDPEIYQELIDKSNYYRGFMPVMSKTIAERIARGQLGKWLKQTGRRAADVFTTFEEDTGLSMIKDQKYITELGDGYFGQIAYGRYKAHTELGPDNRMESKLGLQRFNTPKGREWKTVDPGVNNDISMDLQNTLNYFVVSTTRIIEYESYALPAINAIKFKLETEQDLMGVNNKRTLEAIDSYIDQSIIGRVSEIGDIGGINIDKTLQGLTKAYVRPLVMAFNPNVVLISASANFLSAHIRALANKLAGSWQFHPEDLVYGTQKFFTEHQKATQLAMHLQVVSMTEYDMLQTRIRQVGRRNILDEFISNAGNFYTDLFARTVVMVAQMKRDGSWHAYSLNKEGGIDYDRKKDQQYWKTDGTQTKAQKALEANMRQQLIHQEYMTEDEQYITRGYDTNTMNTLKALSDKYVVGSFDSVTKNLLNNHGIGKLAMVFYNWTSSVLSRTFGKKGYSATAGRWIGIEDSETGEYIAKFQRLYLGGWFEALGRYTNILLRTGKHPFKYMSEDEKASVWEAVLNLGMWGFVIGMYQVFKNKCANGECGINYDWRISKSIYNSLDNLFVLPTLINWAYSPFAVVGILRKGFVTAYGEWNVDPLYFIPGLRQLPAVNPILQETFDVDLMEPYEEFKEEVEDKITE